MAEPENEGVQDEEEDEVPDGTMSIQQVIEEPADLDEKEEEEEDSSEDYDPFERLDEEEEDDEEEQRKYKEYLELVKDIDMQNNRITDLKDRTRYLRDKPCRTRKDDLEYKRLRVAQDQEEIKLRNLINRAMQLQNFGSQRLYGDMEMAPTEFEENAFTALRQDRIICPTRTQPIDCSACNDCDESDDDGFWM